MGKIDCCESLCCNLLVGIYKSICPTLQLACRAFLVVEVVQRKGLFVVRLGECGIQKALRPQTEGLPLLIGLLFVRTVCKVGSGPGLDFSLRQAQRLYLRPLTCSELCLFWLLLLREAFEDQSFCCSPHRLGSVRKEMHNCCSPPPPKKKKN